MIYFITALIMLNVHPPLGWIQYSYPYTNKNLCEKYIGEYKDTLSLSINNHFKDKMVSIQKFECITRDEAVERNSNLGH